MRAGLAVFTVWLVASTFAEAQPPSALPDVAVALRDGTPAQTSAMTRSGAWLLVVTDRPCATCAQLLAQLDATATPEQGARMVVVMGGASPAEAAAQPPRSGGLSTASLYIDQARALRVALAMYGAPLVYGMRGNEIAWRRAGTMPANQLQSLVSSWIR